MLGRPVYLAFRAFDTQMTLGLGVVVTVAPAVQKDHGAVSKGQGRVKHKVRCRQSMVTFFLRNIWHDLAVVADSHCVKGAPQTYKAW